MPRLPIRPCSVLLLTARRVHETRSNIADQLVDETNEPIKPDEDILVFHATSKAQAEELLEHGVVPGRKPAARPTTIIRDAWLARALGKEVGDALDYEPGRGEGPGFYVGPDPHHLEQFGDVVLGIRVNVRDLKAAPERARRQMPPWKALLLTDGYIDKPVRPEDVCIFKEQQ